MNNRREFLADVGRGMLVASVGPALAADLGLAPPFADDDGRHASTFGELEPLVALMQETPADRLVPELVEKLQDGHRPARRSWRPRPLANARDLRRRGLRRLPHPHGPGPGLPDGAASCPRRSGPCRCSRCSTATPTASRSTAGRRHEVLHPVEPAPLPDGQVARRGAPRGRPASRTWPRPRGPSPRIAQGPLGRGVQRPAVRRPGRHRSPPRRPGLAGLGAARPHRQGAGPHAAAPVGPVLRRRGANDTAATTGRSPSPAAEAARPVPAGRPEGRRRGRPDDAWVERLCRDDLRRRAGSRPPTRSPRPWPRGSRRRRSARRSRWRRTSSSCATPAGREADGAGKPPGSVHGDSVGVHACDAANAWRNIARVSDPRNAVACLIVGAYHTAGQSGGPAPGPVPAGRAPRARSRRPTRRTCSRETEAAIQANDQAPRLRPGAPLRRARAPGPAGLRPAAQVRRQRGRGAARREVLPHGHRGVRRDAPGLPLAAARRPWPA